MEYNMKTCPRCGGEKKTNKGIYCQPCAVHIAALKGKLSEQSKKSASKGGLKGGRSTRRSQKKVTLPPIGKK
jgi:hypothetical protein